jgi:syntaxin-binding protein 1
MRLLAIYFITQRPPVPADRRQLCKAAKLTGSSQQLLLNLEEKLMGALDAQANAAAQASPQAAAKGGFFSRLLGGNRQAEVIDATAEGEYTDTRHVCQMKLLLEKLINAQLPTDSFPSMGPQMPYHAQETKSTAQSARKFKPTGRWGGKDKAAISGGRFICFVAGGVSYTESRAGYELMEKESKEIIIGGTHLVTPDSYIEDIDALGPDALVQAEENTASI